MITRRFLPPVCILILAQASPAVAQDIDIFGIMGGQATMTEGQRRAQIAPFVRALTDCISKRALEDTAAAPAFKDGTFATYIVQVIDRCPAFVNRLSAAYDRFYGPDQAGVFLTGAYAKDLPRAVLTRIKPQLVAKVAELKKQEADEEARLKQYQQEKDDAERKAAADRQQQIAEAERMASAERERAEKAKAAADEAARIAEAERLKNVSVATSTAKLLAVKALDCGRGQLKTLVKSGESSEVLASAVMTICRSDVDHYVDAGIDEYKLENKIGTDDGLGVLREKLRADAREHIMAMAVQAKAGVGDFAN